MIPMTHPALKIGVSPLVEISRVNIHLGTLCLYLGKIEYLSVLISFRKVLRMKFYNHKVVACSVLFMYVALTGMHSINVGLC